MADLAQYEQELLRRNAALEERAAASIARAKAVVDGQASSRAGVSALIAKAAAPPSAPLRSPPRSPARADPEAALETLADALYEDEVENFDPERHELDERLRRSVAERRRANAVDSRSPKRAAASSAAARPDGSPKPFSARTSREGAFGGRDPSDVGLIDPAEDPVEFSDDAYGRLAKARIAALRDELSAQARELRDARARLRDRDSELKATLTEKAAVAKQLRSATSALEKERRAASELRAEADAKAREAAEARRDADRSTVRTKASEAETKARDVRLNRALEEVERYKSALAEARDETKGGGAESRREATELRGDVRRLERQKQELTAAFKKQSRLVDVLRKQKTHLEAARVVQFAEEAFLNVLEKGESHKSR